MYTYIYMTGGSACVCFCKHAPKVFVYASRAIYMYVYIRIHTHIYTTGGAAVTFAECFEKIFGRKGSGSYVAAQVCIRSVCLACVHARSAVVFLSLALPLVHSLSFALSVSFTLSLPPSLSQSLFPCLSLAFALPHALPSALPLCPLAKESRQSHQYGTFEVS